MTGGRNASNMMRGLQFPDLDYMALIEREVQHRLAGLKQWRGKVKDVVAAPTSQAPGARSASSTPSRTRTPSRTSSVAAERFKQEARAAASGFADGVFLGGADPASALISTLRGRGGADGFFQRYNNNLAAEHAQDRYDQAHYGGARFGGQAAGAVAGIAATGGALGGINAARLGAAGIAAGRLAPNIGHVLRLSGASGAAGGVGNAAVQAGIDKATGQKFTSGDLVGAVAGGAIGGVAAPFVGPVRGAALAAISSPVVQGALNLEAPSPVEVVVGGGLGASAGRYAQAAVSRMLKGMTSHQKGKLGEALARNDSRLLGQKVLGVHVSTPVSGGRTYADHITASTANEAKFGRWAKISPRQREAIAEIPNYIVRHYLPEDLQNAYAVMLTGLGAPAIPIPRYLKLSADRPHD